MAGRTSRALDYQRAEAMGLEKISRLLMRFSVPAIVANEGEAFYKLFDAIWCGRIGTEALAALTVAGPLMAVYELSASEYLLEVPF